MRLNRATAKISELLGLGRAAILSALFLIGDSASSALMRKLLRTPGIQLLDFR